ncbi:WD40 repeat-like protein [Aureobasidium pullulans]|uniref:WD40 repeat-like protein n=1 Tax=Aureobasidium pullulans TaxID=5580 RepID=A0A4T0D4S4_AURPU|nr:WD40 repeat-like protein [Aureobasidium pullulans]
MSSEKRPASSSMGSGQMVKRQKSDNSMALTSASQNGTIIHSTHRGPALSAPVMELSGHTGEVLAARFNPEGNYIASAGTDRNILLWRTSGDCENYGILSGHKGAILDLQWSRDSRNIFSASADMHIASWDLETAQRIRRHQGHDEVINALDISRRGEDILFSASDDGYIGIWDPRQKAAVDFIETNFPVTAIALAEAGNELYSGSIDNDIKVWDLRKKQVSYSLIGHTDTITSLAVSPDSQTLLSNSHDSTVRTWDIRPFAPTERHIRTFDGAPTGMDKYLIRATWDTKGKRIAAGSGDRSVVVWDAGTGKLLQKLPGHKGSVNDVRFAPNDEPLSKSLLLYDHLCSTHTDQTLVLSASTDRNLMLGSLST